MNTATKSIVVTGAAGFIGSCLVGALNREGFDNLVLVDDFNRPEKEGNLMGKLFARKVDRSQFEEWMIQHPGEIAIVFHLGARTDTTEFNTAIFDQLNLEYSRMMWESCTRESIPLIYASSAATYGSGSLGYDDDHSLIPRLKPLNPYGQSKQDFDEWVLKQSSHPPQWTGLKFFNVYGPNEYHKGRMASVIFHAYHQILQTGKARLFKSHIPEYQDGMQVRDFIFVKDVVDVCLFLMKHKTDSGIYNLGTGEARTFFDLARACFQAMGIPENIEFIDIPEDIRERYQYFTEAQMAKLQGQGYRKPFTRLEEGIEEYVKDFLIPGRYY